MNLCKFLHYITFLHFPRDLLKENCVWTFKMCLANTFFFFFLNWSFREGKKCYVQTTPPPPWKVTSETAPDQPSKTKHSIYICCLISHCRKLFPGKIINKRIDWLEQSRKMITWNLKSSNRRWIFFQPFLNSYYITKTWAR